MPKPKRTIKSHPNEDKSILNKVEKSVKSYLQNNKTNTVKTKSDLSKKIFTKKEINFFKNKKKLFFDNLNEIWHEMALLIEDRRELEIENKRLKKKLNLKNMKLKLINNHNPK